MTDLNQGTQNSNFSTSTGSGSFMNTDSSNPPRPDNNLVLAIVGTVLGLCSPCCIGFILGIIAIVFSTQVDSKYNIGDYLAAEGNAKKAKTFALIAIGLFALNLIYTIIMFAVGGMDSALEQYRQILEQVQ